MAETEISRPGRNEPCHCGSGRKYKHCCLGKDEETERASRSALVTEAAAPPAEQKDKPRPTLPRVTDAQPWKRAARNTRGVPKFTGPRKAG
ncbi:MAG: SEC-C metal-binding domain-containing protein [Acidobacteriota bacterium]